MTLQIGGEITSLSTSGGTYVNVLRSMTDGGITIWGNSYRHPCYLILAGHNWLIVTFDDEQWRDQELPVLIEKWKADAVYVIPTMEKIA